MTFCIYSAGPTTIITTVFKEAEKNGKLSGFKPPSNRRGVEYFLFVPSRKSVLEAKRWLHRNDKTDNEDLLHQAALLLAQRRLYEEPEGKAVFPIAREDKAQILELWELAGAPAGIEVAKNNTVCVELRDQLQRLSGPTLQETKG